MVTLKIDAAFIKKMLLFCSKGEARWVIANDMCVRKFGENQVEFAATDGMKLLVIRRPLEGGEEIDDNEYIVPIDNLPLKGKYLSYLLTIREDREAVYNDTVNVFRFPLKEAKYPNYRELFEPLKEANHAEKYTIFKWENIKAALAILDMNMYDIPRTNGGNVFMWYKKDGDKDIYVTMCSMSTN